MDYIERTKREKILDDALLGFMRGTEAVHSLPSYLITMPDERDWDKTVGRTKLKKVIETLTIAAESAAYIYAAANGVPAFFAPAITNFVDGLGYFIDKAQESDLMEPGDKINWEKGAFWEDVFHTLYHDHAL
jgi:hypothetical protein